MPFWENKFELGFHPERAEQRAIGAIGGSLLFKTAFDRFETSKL
jgi:hypothetical protein